eukprot:TRINITY_DN14048_c0_g1_i2.p1 TRINITY_DN14048_c0_g1~~TRINITY_DN14048_c0_g1_i2.p1  ORF type:complete len:202 (-),score=53.37 TRINITY_DN14048_c0_g1_i2:229-834(-)
MKRAGDETEAGDEAAAKAARTEPEGKPQDASSDATAPAASSSAADGTDSTQKVEVEAIYHRRNPHKLAGVPALLEKYKGKEAVLYAKVCKTYDLDPSKFYSDAKAWEQYDADAQEETPDAAGSGGGASSTGGGGLFGAASGGGGVALPSLFGGLGPVSGPLFAAMGKPSAGAAADSSDSDEGDKAKPAAKPAEKQAECKTQ